VVICSIQLNGIDAIKKPKEKFEAIPLDDLWGLHERIAKLLSERILAESGNSRRASCGLSADRQQAVLSQSRSSQRVNVRGKYPKVFRNTKISNAPFETWSGRGERPRWLVSALRPVTRSRILKYPMPVVEGLRPRLSGITGAINFDGLFSDSVIRSRCIAARAKPTSFPAPCLFQTRR